MVWAGSFIVYFFWSVPLTDILDVAVIKYAYENGKHLII